MGQRAVRQKICDACIKDTLATSTETFAVGNVDYEIDLCEKHADRLERELSAWARMAREKERPTFFGRSRVALDNHRNTSVERRAAPRTNSTPERPPMEHPVVKKTWYLSSHAEERLEERGPAFGFTRRDVFLCAQAPESVEPNHGGAPDTWIHVRGNVALIVSRIESTILTVMPAEYMQQEALHASV